MSQNRHDPSGRISAEKTWLAGSIMTGAGYGVVLSLFWLAVRSLWYRIRAKDADYARNCFFLLYVCVMFTLGSLFMGSNTHFAQLAFINDRHFPGGPSAWEGEMFSIGVNEISNVAFVLAGWCSAALMVWRCVIIYRDCGNCPWSIIVILGTMLLASVVLGILFLWQISSPLSSPYFFPCSEVNYTLPYLFLALAINITVTILIIIRLYFYRYRVRMITQAALLSKERTSIASIIIESAAIYSTFSLLFLIPFATKNLVANVFFQVLGEGQIIAPLLIIYREALGKGWISSSSTGSISSDTPIRQNSDIQFTSQHIRSAGIKSVDLRDMAVIAEEGMMDVDVDVDDDGGGGGGDVVLEISRRHEEDIPTPGSSSGRL